MHTNGQNPTKTYDSDWKKVTDLQAKGLSKSALTEVREIYRKARQEKQDAQVIKAAINMVGLQAENREESEIAAIQDFERELAASSGVVKSILSSLTASQYYSYYQYKRWQLYQRTETSGFVKEDINTWSTGDFHKRITELYLASLENEKELQQTRLEPFDAIITKGNTRHLRPTLYDLLAHTALRYFSSDERDLKKPVYAFEINAASAFDPAADFIHRKFETKDSASLELYALKLYQKLLAFHIDDPKPDALIDADLLRIQFVKQKSVHENTDELYYLAINHVADQYQQTPAAAQAWYLLADYHFQRGSTYKATGDTTHRLEKAKAVSLCKEIIKQNPETEGGINAANLLNSIRQRALLFQAEQVVVPEKPFLLFVEYSNINKLYLKLVTATTALKTKFEARNGDEFWRTVSKAPAIRKWEQVLPDPKDYQEHSVQIKADALPVGEYMLLASSSPDFSDTQSVGGVRLLYVSNISYVQRERDYFVLNRDSGQPLAGATVKRWDATFDYRTQTYKRNLGATYTTDKNGYFKENERTQKQAHSESLEITFGGDKLFIQEPSNTYYYDQLKKDDIKSTVYLFTDRSLYRPGQTVYFKGIAAAENAVLKDQERKIKIKLHNANGEKIDSTTKMVNDFGSFSGTFILPRTGLNGNFSITADDKHTISFHVEEYKRPRFEVRFDTLRNTYQLGDLIRVTGTGTAYAGNQIGGAKVVYRVVRNERYSFPWTRRGRYFPNNPPKEIAHGETITDNLGQFQVSFEALPNAKTDKSLNPIFNYTIYADVTDTNGETRSAETTVSVGYKSILIKSEIPDKLAADSLKSLKIRTENMNGEFVSAPVTVKITRLIPENRLIRPRYWSQPDLFVMTKAEFLASFPHDEYAHETEMEEWPEQEVDFQKEQQTADNQDITIQNSKLSPGFYKIDIAAKDENGEEVSDTRYIELTNPESKQLLKPEYQWTESGPAVEPGQETNVKLGTSAEDVFVISSSGKSHNPSNFSFFKLNNEKTTFPISVKETDRGGYAIDYVFVKHNRVHQAQNHVNVPWTNKELKIEYATFRDKTLPGSKEQWKVKISGYKKEQIAAEMLASMYDASLDQFYPHQWTKPNHWPVGSMLKRWSNGFNFISKDAEIVSFQIFPGKSLLKSYDELPGTSSYSPRGGGLTRSRRSPARNQMGVREMEIPVEEVAFAVVPHMLGEDTKALSDVVVVGYGNQKPAALPPTSPVGPRKNFNETAFFLPQLLTDKNGEIEFSFTLPEALTRWKFQALAHTTELAFGYSSKEIITQKELMVQPNAPRFFREGDKITFPVKVVSLADRELKGTVSLQLFDAETNEEINSLFQNNAPQPFTIAARQSVTVGFNIEIPKNFTKTLSWRVIAKADGLSDGEENSLPVLSNRMLVTESLPIQMRGAGKKQFKFDKLLNSARSKTLSHESLTVEYTSNPAWYAVQSLPYLMEYPYECAEQTWNRYYANALASSIVKNTPKIAQVFNSWKTTDTAALASNLQKNEELKAVLLEETPWVLAAKSEAEQKRNIAMLFDLSKMSGELDVHLVKLREMQNESGGFPWFKGGHDDRYITQYIVTGIGRLLSKKVISGDKKLYAILDKAFPYLDQMIKEDYDQLIKSKSKLQEYVPSPLQVQYLFMRTYFDDLPIMASSIKASDFFTARMKATWIRQPKYLQGMIALTQHRTKDAVTAKAILKSLRETAINNEELGMHWKNNRSWWWQEAPVEQQALLIEAFHEIEGNKATVDDLKTWLLKNKQTNSWESTKATADACYALLMTGSDWLSEEKETIVRLGDTVIKAEPGDSETGTGYFKKRVERTELRAEMGNIEIDISKKDATDKSASASWGAVYWQYFEDLDKITFSETPLKLAKKLFIEKKTDKGPTLFPINEGDFLKVGDKIIVRLELRTDRDMEYVHMKDMRASSFEPVNVLSGYKWQGGLGYYESTKDASTNFFFDQLRKGTYIFEYALFVNHEGDFGNGITSIQCMYAPEFSAHSEGIRVKVSKD